MRVMSEAVQIFDPLYLCKMSTADVVTVLYALAEKLMVFGFPQFNESFIEKLRKEQPKVVREAKKDHDLDRIPSTRQYQTRLQKRIKRKKLHLQGTEVDWKRDAGEYAQRIWQWWKPRKDKFPHHGLAIRLVVLLQLSSCSVERVFSKLESIRVGTGGNLKEDMTEVRLFLQCNGDLDELYKALVTDWRD